MATCDVCGRRVDLPHRCIRCEGTYCGRHRLPEAHDCAAPDDRAAGGDDGTRAGAGAAGHGGDDADWSRGETRVGGDDSPAGDDSTGEETWVGRVRESVRGRATYGLLSLMVLTFGLQSVVFPLAGYGPGTAVWRATFTLSTRHPAFVWTWFTAVFAHAGLFHLLLNGVVVFFFGTVVEEYVGPVRYVLLFLSTGALAGLAQVGVLLAQGTRGAVLGASGAALAVLGTLTGINPRMRVYVFFVLPVPVWLFTGGYAFVTVRAIRSAGTGAGGVAQAAHLVGLLLGLGYGAFAKLRGTSVPDDLRFGGS